MDGFVVDPAGVIDLRHALSGEEEGTNLKSWKKLSVDLSDHPSHWTPHHL